MRASHSSRCLALSLVLLWGCGGTAPTHVEPTTDQVAQSSRGMVVAAQPLATAAGVEMLERGGNAADAAVAAAFAVSVVEPSMNSIGGRTQILVRTAEGTFHGIDATTQAPDTYDPDTAPQAGYGYPTVGLPGAVAGLTRLLDEHGTLPLATAMEPAIRYASEGFALLPGEAARQASTAEQLRESEGATLYYIEPDGSPYDAGDHFVQNDLAMVLRRIASGGADAFYRGEIARAMADDIVDAGGHVTAAALAGYRAEDARVVRGSYRGHELVGTFTPAAGAMTIGILQIIENFDMAGADETTWALVVGQALALGFEAARTHRGPDAWQLLTSREWAREQAERVRMPVAAAMGPGPAAAPRSSPEPVAAYFAGPDDDGHTTHLSTADADGMTVSLTQTIGPAMGSKIATPGLGFLYAATLGGYLGRLEPGERARSNIAPFMVLDGDDPMLVLGAAGGARIVSAVVQAVCRVVDQGLSLPEALAAARLHPMQGSLNPTGSESGFQMETSPDIGWSPEVIAELRQLGFAVQEVPRSGAFGRIHGMSYDATASSWTGAADPDWEGSAAAPRN
ncbi:MAG: gamma-glutamyltransferase [Gammaproteobacteria bacterium]|nr:gamma-glutamyltransferase [Gammaproteobacteria bacterium]